MKSPFLLLPLFVSTLPAPTLLRYQYKPGQVYRYHVEDQITVRIRAADGSETVLSAQAAKMTLQKKVVSYSGETGVVETAPLDGTTELKAGASITTQVVRPIRHIYTLTPMGTVVKQERRVPAGEKDPGPQILEGLTFTLPGKAVPVGATWSQVLMVRGIGGSRFPVTVRSQYVREVTRLRHPCAEIHVTFAGKFSTQPVQAGGQPAPGSLSGKATYYFGTDIGQDVEAAGDIEMSIGQSTPAGRAAQTASRVIHFTTRQTLIK
jgi:hypothetical protein